MRLRCLCFFRLLGFLTFLGAFILLWKHPNIAYLSKSSSHESDYDQATGNTDDRSNHNCDKVISNSIQSISCVVNGMLTPGCYLTQGEEVLIPFKVVRNYLKVFGSLNISSSTFYISHTNVEVPKPNLHKHSPTGLYMQFNKLSVEKRHHVKLVVADEGVPISNQWDSYGYPYPIQIAQFGLNHFSQLVTSDQVGFQDVENILFLDDQNMDLDLTIPNDNVLHHWTSEKRLDRSSDVLILSDPGDRIFSVTPKLQGWSHFIMVGHQWTYGSFVELLVLWHPPPSAIGPRFNRLRRTSVAYNCSSSPNRHQKYASIASDGSRVVFWMPECEKLARLHGTINSIKLARDIYTDLMKVFFPLWKLPELVSPSSNEPLDNNFTGYHYHVQVLEVNFYVKRHSATLNIVIEKLRLGKLTNLQATSSDENKRKLTPAEKLLHEIRFMSAADWFVHHQDDNGGWSVNVRRFLKGRKALKPGWYSAMGQGQAMSLLVRAYNYTSDLSYLQACCRSLDLFNLSIKYNGVRSYFLNQSDLIWFEEYPFDPPIHILNGFIYSLIGLYDFTQVAASNPHPLVASSLLKAQTFLNSGLTSLSKLLPLFDSGSGSFYDLRHLSADHIQSMKYTEPRNARNNFQLSSGPNRARWSYHSLHIRQLQTLVDLDPEHSVQWQNTASRWIAYLQGFQSLQN